MHFYEIRIYLGNGERREAYKMTTVGEILNTYLEAHNRRNICDAFEKAVAERIECLEKGVSNPKQFFFDLIRKSTFDIRLISYSMREGFPETDETNFSLFKSEFDRQGRIRGGALREDYTRYYYIKGKGDYVHTLEVELQYKERD